MDMPAILVFTALLSEPLHHRGTASAQPTSNQHDLYNYRDTHRAPYTPRISLVTLHGPPSALRYIRVNADWSRHEHGHSQ
jgi:hypothetical protein